MEEQTKSYDDLAERKCKEDFSYKYLKSQSKLKKSKVWFKNFQRQVLVYPAEPMHLYSR